MSYLGLLSLSAEAHVILLHHHVHCDGLLWSYPPGGPLPERGVVLVHAALRFLLSLLDDIRRNFQGGD